ncbi:MGMT family protein [Candidatus Roizmanbacteria bacterium]|nr:MGMT family protein [Candidatus Roizmanbacteria bacterium]
MEQYRLRIYKLLQMIPKGKVTTYGAIAQYLNISSPRIVGRILHLNTHPEKFPCHRVVYSNGALSPGYAFGGYKAQKRKLAQEGIAFKHEKVLLQKHLVGFFD